MTTEALAVKLADEELLDEARTRASARLSGRDRWTSYVLAAGFLAAAFGVATIAPWRGKTSLALTLSFVLVYAITSRVEFEFGTGSAVPTQLVFVPMLLALPPAIVPLVAVAGFVLGGCPDYLSGRLHPERALVLVSSSWYSLGPALVLVLVGAEGRPRLGSWPVYLAAISAQFVFDFTSVSLRERLAFRRKVRQLVPFLLPVYAIDALLAPVGLLTAIAASGASFAFLLVLPLVALLALLAWDRRRRIDRAVAFNRAYHGASTAARRDALTGLANRLAWEEAVAVAEAQRTESDCTVSVIVVDIDGLKAANDTRGHDFGDRLIATVAGLAAESIRRGDTVARIGGDEIAILMPAADELSCAETASRLAQIIGRHPPVDSFSISASVGWATCPPAVSVADAQKRADAAMYEQKQRTGRSRPAA